MHLDKPQLALVSGMIETTYRPVIKRAICNLVLLDISNISSTVKAPNQQLRNKAIIEKLHTQQARDSLIKDLMLGHRFKRGDLINEILKQYGLILNKDEIDLYHEHMGRIFDDEIENVKQLLHIYAYTVLYEISKTAYQQ